MYDDCFDDDDCPFTSASQSNDDDDCLMSNVVDDDPPFRDSQSYDEDDDDDDLPFTDDSQSNVNQVNDPLPSHESRPTRHMQSGRIELLEYSPTSSQMPLQPSYIPTFEPSGLSPDIIARLTPAELSQNPEFMQLSNRLEFLQTTLNAYLYQRRIQARKRVWDRVLEWRLGVHA